MLFDNRLVGGNSTQDTRSVWADESWPHLRLLWSYLILLSFARLLPLDPLLVHALSILLVFVFDVATPMVAEATWQI